MPILYVISGHGAGDPGASGNGRNEADVVRDISTRLKALGGSSVVELNKNINWYASKKVNAELKKTVGNNPVIELHLDSAAGARGGHVIIKEGYKPDAYDNALATFVKSFFPGRANVIVERGNLANVNRAAANNINYRLLECCFITSSDDMKKLTTQMDAFCKGILNAFGIKVGETMKEGWVKDSKGWWYRYADGSWPKSKWLKLKGIWYWFGADGYAVANCCKQIDGKWYAFDKDCHMLTSVKVDSSGALVL